MKRVTSTLKATIQYDRGLSTEERTRDILTTHHLQREIVAKLNVSDITRIMDFIQGAVYCYSKNCPVQFFCARDLFGGMNANWAGTPLQQLYDWHAGNGSSNANEMAGKDLGWLLLKVLHDDSRTYKLMEGYTHSYKQI